jgi:hypothetical protein
MNKYKHVRISIWSIINIICILIYIYYILNGEVLLCDSNESINEFIVDTTHDSDSNSTHPVPGLFSRFKRRLFWYINGKKSRQFSSYSEYKNYWNSNSEQNSLWKIIKDDFRKARFNASKDHSKSLDESNTLMTNIRNERINKNILDQQRRNMTNTK